ncbi:MAG TPA: hypothetical protein VJ276_01270 [Thermoanaerobaculia bacterium]|nr:hypothetical protein [Thermoanaerobaculia bacterium]
MRRFLLAVVLLTACAKAAESPFDAAEAAAADDKFGKARELFREAAAKDADPTRRDKAAIRLANIEWRAFHDAAGGRRALALVRADGDSASDALVERARLEAELVRDLPAARRAADAAIARAAERSQRSRAIVVRAGIDVEAAIRERLGGREVDPAPLRAAITALQGVIEKDGPTLAPSRLLLDAALMTGDMPTAVKAWRWYYGDAPAVDAQTLGKALAGARFFTEAVLVTNDPEVRIYEAALRKIHDIADEHYRTVAVGQRDDKAFQRALDDAGRALWTDLRLPGAYDQKKLANELGRRYGAVINLGKTGGVFDIHYGHRIIDERREVAQYGKRGTLRFIALDGIVSNGYSSWRSDGGSGDGGWSAEGVIYQVRPMYANGPVRLWLRTADPELRTKRDKEIAEETARDAERAKTQPIRYFPGLAMRLDRQYGDALLATLERQGLTGDALRDAFLARVRSDVFESSIWAHEGRHAIDQKDGIKDSPELEFRAKLSEVALGPAPRKALTGGIISGEIGSATPHGKANKRIAEGLVAWMKAHAAQIQGLDANAPLLPQLDKLTDEQLRAAFRSMDPLATGDVDSAAGGNQRAASLSAGGRTSGRPPRPASPLH